LNGGTGTTTFYSKGIVFSDGSKLTQSASTTALIWDDVNYRLGIGVNNPIAPIDVNMVANNVNSRNGINSAIYSDNFNSYLTSIYGASTDNRASGYQDAVNGLGGESFVTGGGDLGNLSGVYGYTQMDGSGTISTSSSLYSYANVRNSGTVNLNTGLYIEDDADVDRHVPLIAKHPFVRLKPTLDVDVALPAILRPDSVVVPKPELETLNHGAVVEPTHSE
jgi:hypothetical protein